MVKFLGVVASILVDGIELPEYQIVFDEIKKTAQCFIPSEPGKEYTIRVARDRTKKEKTDIRCSIYCDGSKEPIKSTSMTQGEDKAIISHVRESRTTCRPFVFSELATTDDLSLVLGSAPMDPGSIRINFWRIRVNGHQHYKESSMKIMLDDNVVVHEQSKKAGGIKTSLGPLRTTKEKHMTHVLYSRKENDPFVGFIFLHRTEAMLKARDIIPRSPPPVDLDDDEDSDDAETQKSRIRALEIKLKAERSKLSSSKHQRTRGPLIKQEIQSRNGFHPGEIIDMTHL